MRQEIKIGSDKIELYRESGLYNVRRFADSICNRRIQEYWKKFEKLKDARRAFKRQTDIARIINKRN